jgi:hypothetical protein
LWKYKIIQTLYSIQDNFFNPTSTDNSVLDSQKMLPLSLKIMQTQEILWVLSNSNVISTDVGGGVLEIYYTCRIKVMYLITQVLLDIQGIDGGKAK